MVKNDNLHMYKVLIIRQLKENCTENEITFVCDIRSFVLYVLKTIFCKPKALIKNRELYWTKKFYYFNNHRKIKTFIERYSEHFFLYLSS